MNEIPFTSFYRHLQQHYTEGEYVQALKLATQALDQYPDQRTVLDYWRMTMAARTGAEELALNVFQEALDRGEWYSELLLRRSPSFQALLDNPQYERLIALNQEIAEQDHARTFPMYILRPEGRCATGEPSCPLFLGLHAGATTVYTSMPFWAPVAAAGWLVAAPQSAQAIWKGAYVWNDRQIAENDLQKHFATLRETYAVDSRRTLLAGHAAGGETAVWLALHNAIEISGFLAIGPGGPFLDDPDEWKPLLNDRLPPELRGYFIVGKNDPTIPHENIRKLVEELNQAGIACELETLPGLANDYDPEYDLAILRALDFLSSSA